jgi:hypothetical protein
LVKMREKFTPRKCLIFDNCCQILIFDRFFGY